jgi:ribonuclease P protein component
VRWFDALRRQSEIAYVRRRGRRAGLATLSAFGLEADGPRCRIGITVSKAVGGAVVRNRVRRRIRAALEALAPARPVRVLFVARPEAAAESYARLAADVATALHRLDA